MAARHFLAAWALAISPACIGAELGTLFHTPQERQLLDRQRRGDPVEAPSATGADQPPPRDPVVTGYVRRSDGRNTVWIDGRPLSTRDDPRAVDPKAARRNPPSPTSAPPPAGAEKSTPSPAENRPRP